METLKHNENSHIHHSTQLMPKKTKEKNTENKFAFSASCAHRTHIVKEPQQRCIHTEQCMRADGEN